MPLDFGVATPTKKYRLDFGQFQKPIVEELKKIPGRFLMPTYPYPERLITEPAKVFGELTWGFPAIAGMRAIKSIVAKEPTTPWWKALKPAELLKEKEWPITPELGKKVKQSYISMAPFGVKNLIAKAPDKAFDYIADFGIDIGLILLLDRSPSMLYQLRQAKTARDIAPIVESLSEKSALRLLREGKVSPKDLTSTFMETGKKAWGERLSAIRKLAPKEFRNLVNVYKTIRTSPTQYFFGGVPAKQNLINAIMKVRPTLKSETLTRMSIPALTRMAESLKIDIAKPPMKPIPEEVDRGAIPGEPLETYDKGRAALFINEEGKYYIKRKDGSLVYNPKTKTALFDTVAEAQDQYIAKPPVKPEIPEEPLLEEMPSREELGLGPTLMQTIKEFGGIAPYKKGMVGALREEYSENVPIFLRNKTGLPLDEMADTLARHHPELGVTSESELLSALGEEKVITKRVSTLTSKLKKVKIPSVRKKLQEELRSERLKIIAKQLTRLAEIAPHLVTPKQQAYAHILKERKLLTDRQYKRLMRVFTGKKTMAYRTPTGKIKKAPMTRTEAQEFIKAEKKLVPKELGEGVTIPRKKALVPSGFFGKLTPEQLKRGVRPRPAEGRPAGVMSRFTPTMRYMKKVGAYEQVYRPMKLAFWKRMAEDKRLKALTRKVFKGIKDDSPKDEAMFEYKERTITPEKEKLLTAEDKKNVDILEEKFKDFLSRINRARVSLHKKPIIPRENYAPHIFDAVTETVMKEKYPLSNETLGALQDFVISTKTTGRFLQRRKGAENYRKSLQASWRAYKNMALDIIHYSRPTYAAKSYIKYYPPTTQRYLKAFLNEGMFRKAGEIQREIKESTKWLDKIVEKAPIISRPTNTSKSIADTSRALMHIGGIGLNYTTVVKNMTQSVLTYNLVDSVDTTKAMELLSTDIRKFVRIAATNPMFLGRFPFEIREVDLMRILRSTMIPYRMVDMFNVAFAYNAGLIHELKSVAGGRSIDEMLDGYLKRYTGDVDQVLLDMETGEGFGKQIEDAITLTGEMSQWSYYKPDMPRIFWTDPTATLAIFQSWPLYKTLHHYPELFNRLFKGTDFKGRPVSKEQRMGLFKDLVLMALIAAGLGELGIDIRRTVGPGVITIPFINSPYVKLLQGTSKVISGAFIADPKTRNWLINDGINDIKRTAWLFIPAGVAIRRELKRAKPEKAGEFKLKSYREKHREGGYRLKF